MKNILFKAFLACAVMASLSAHARTIEVDTLVDEDGINPAACSLREALKAAATAMPYGGCPAGERNRSDRIQLAAGTYPLTSVLMADSDVIIAGVDTKRPDGTNPLTGSRPDRVRPSTFIIAASGHRVFDTSGAVGGLSLVDLDITGSSVAGDGAVIYAAASVSMDNTIIRNGAATGTGPNAGRGGAVFLATSGAGLTVDNGTFINNTATQGGGLVAMNCEENLAIASHQVEISRSLVRGSSGGSGAGAIAMCGSASLALTSSTLTESVANATHGLISHIPALPKTGSLAISHLTAVANTGTGPVLRTGQLGVATLNASLLAWNVGPGCSVGTPVPANVSGDFNAVSDTTCSLLFGAGTTNNLQTITALQPDELDALGNHGGLTDVYLPAITSTIVLDQGPGLGICAGVDQRGASRKSGAACDRGAAERQSVTAVEDTGQNKVRTNRVAYVDVLKNDTAGEGTMLVPAMLQVGTVTAVPEVAATPITGTCSAVANPAPILTRPLDILADGRASVTGKAPIGAKVIVRFPDGTNQSVTAGPTGNFGPVISATSLRNRSSISVVSVTDAGVLGSFDPGNESLADSIIYDREADPVTLYPERSDRMLMISSVGGVPGTVTCEYTVRDDAGNLSNVGKAEVVIKNMAPKAVKDEYVLAQGQRSLQLNLTINDTDEDDGFYGLKADGTPNLADYPVKIIDQPVLGRIEGDTVPCIDNTPTNLTDCYLGTVTYVPFNSQTPFDDSFTYRIIDVKGEDSGSVTVVIKSSVPPPGQGGSADLALLLLLAAAGLRRVIRV
ncbi:MAG: CSLREA domain-containing protein [Moraxellaceae bacterium]|nr:CSLREA domain-containing protein [Moraxellaceae bacterium]